MNMNDILLSSAKEYIGMLVRLVRFSRSLTQITKSDGERLELVGKPALIIKYLEENPTTRVVRLLRKFETKRANSPSTPNAIIFERSAACQTLSNALDISRATTQTHRDVQ